MAQCDPKPPISYLHSRRSAIPNFCAMEINKTVVGGLNLPARSGRSSSSKIGLLDVRDQSIHCFNRDWL
jgi:hypothetical protein